MRVYIPVTSSSLGELVRDGLLTASAEAPLTAFAVTPELQGFYVNDADVEAEELEYAALSEAARGSLRLLDAEPGAARRRAVLAAEVADDLVEVRDDLDRGVVRLREPVPLAAIAALHIDDADAQNTVALAAEAVIAADLGDDSSRELVDDAEGFELSWYANQEIADVLNTL